MLLQPVGIGETWASTNIARRCGRCPRGQRLKVGIPHGHWRITTLVAGITPAGILAPWVLDGPINRDAFEIYARRFSISTSGQTPSSSWTTCPATRDQVRQTIEVARGKPALPAAYSPDFNPIENAFAKLKALLRQAAE